MASRKIILLLIAAVVGIGTMLTVHGLVSPEATGTPAPQAASQILEIAAAARDLPTGTILKETDVKWIQWIQNADTGNLLVKGKTNPADLAGAVVRDGFRAGEPIISTRVAHPRDQGFLAAVLTPGMRAMSISLSPTAEVAGFIFPGDRVDVILTHSFSRKDIPNLAERHISETILQNARVLALDQRSDNQSTDAKIAQLATLELSQKDAEKLALAVDMSGAQAGRGSLLLVLRSLAIDDKAQVGRSEPTWDSDISSSYPTVNGDDGLMQRVQVMRGKNISENIFERHR